jgi:hypothetical protein
MPMVVVPADTSAEPLRHSRRNYKDIDTPKVRNHHHRASQSHVMHHLGMRFGFACRRR